MCDNKHEELVEVDPRLIGDQVLPELKRFQKMKRFHFLEPIIEETNW